MHAIVKNAIFRGEFGCVLLRAGSNCFSADEENSIKIIDSYFSKTDKMRVEKAAGGEILSHRLSLRSAVGSSASNGMLVNGFVC